MGDSAIGTLAVGTVMRHSDRNDFEFGVREFITAFLSGYRLLVVLNGFRDHGYHGAGFARNPICGLEMAFSAPKNLCVLRKFLLLVLRTTRKETKLTRFVRVIREFRVPFPI